jgi:small subunit ribosomal protein S20
MRQDEKRRQRNQTITTFYRHRIKECRAAIAAGDASAAGEKLHRATQAIHGAVSKGALQENTANRYVSRLARAVKALGAAKPSSPA